MDNKFIITITDIKGSRQYNIHQFVKHILLYVILSIIVVILVSFATIRLLLGEIATIEENRNKLIEDYNRIEAINKSLDEEIAQKNNDIAIIRGRLGHLEGFVGVSNGETNANENPEANIVQMLERVDVARITAEQKGFTLRMVPNGNPLQHFQVSSNFGYREHPLIKKREFHTGIDLRVPVGTSVYTTADGVVSFSKKGYNGGYGNMVKVEHAYGFHTVYAHLSELAVKEGEFVKKGQVVAYSGNTGLSTGPHLHYEVLFLGNRLQPKHFMNWTMRNYEDIFEREKEIKWQSLLDSISTIREFISMPMIDENLEHKEIE
ncbi:MAG: M23 family metallopeptidase [Helicobacter sp.]|nr:M23 family metallopeptidase [Helicobacter sp.]MDE6044079.1 M23 family metallopeptidase [Helicobacter sp.]MDE7196615.1 M23 family metallopeptidase [Helicobacter sp.]